MSVREIRLDDLPAIAQLYQRVGWPTPSRAKWERVWRDNPANPPGAKPWSPGWVLEQEGRVVGCMGNLVQIYQWGDRVLRAATAVTFAVLPEHRGASLQLVFPFARQPGLDLLLNTTASPESSKIFQFLKFEPVPVPDYHVSYYWILRPAGFLHAALRKKAFGQWLAAAGGTALAPALWLEDRLRGRGPRPPRDPHLWTDVIGVEGIGPEFDDLWTRKCREGRRLLAVRNAQILRWHYTRENPAHAPKLVRVWKEECLAGYAVVVRKDSPNLGLKRSLVADFFLEGDDPAVLRQLLRAAWRQAYRDGAQMLQIVGGPANLRRLIEADKPHRLEEGTRPFLFRAPDAALHAALQSADAWYPTLYDGDGSI